MDKQILFEQIVASLHEATLDETLWLPTSALIDEALGSKGNHLCSVTLRGMRTSRSSS